MTFVTALFATLLIAGASALSAVAAPEKSPPKASGKPSKLMLYGRIDELSYMCSSAGLRLDGPDLPAKVDKISLGSAAAYSGVREGDTVLKADTEPNMLVLTVMRAGKQYQAKIAVNVFGLRKEFESQKVRFSIGDSPFDKDLKTLAGSDVVILLDRCQTMNDTNAGCPGDISKWMWCKQQIDNLWLATNRILEGGFNLVLFNDRYETRKGVTLYDLKQVFDQVRPFGARKNISLPLDNVLKDYFKAKPTSTKPLVVIVLTEGTQNVGEPLQDVLIAASKNMTRPGQVTVAFMQVGESIMAEELFDDLDQNLVAKGARFHMVKYKPFSQLRNRGLLQELLATVREAKAATPAADRSQ